MKLDTTQPTALSLDQKAEGQTGRGLRVSGTFEGYVTRESLWSWILGYQDFPEEHD